MIRNSYIFLHGISYKTERNIVNQGVKHWNDFLKIDKIPKISEIRKRDYDKAILLAKQQLIIENASYFNILPKKETWRLYEYFKDEALFLDLEVDGKKNIILIGLYDGEHTKIFVKNINLDFNLLRREIKKYKLLITFNGSSFDLPLLKKHIPEINMPHIDLKHCCSRLNLKNGLKEIEKQLDIKRPRNLNGHPVELWKALHASFDREYLDLLVQYNEEDIINLKTIMDYCYNKLKNEYRKEN